MLLEVSLQFCEDGIEDIAVKHQARNADERETAFHCAASEYDFDAKRDCGFNIRHLF
jgi:hypothetical protein